MPKLLVATLALFLLIIAGGGSDPAHSAARTIPWNCSDWQAAPAVDDAENARVSVILESLAANRGKTLYCAVDQSDTFTKAETWQAGRDRNERDDTVYQGQNGRFRGFLAAQEGYLTDGESGVTGISRERVFEFPEEPRRGWKRVTVRRQFTVTDINYLAQTEEGEGSGTGTNYNTQRGIARTRFGQGFSGPPATPAVCPNADTGTNCTDDKFAESLLSQAAAFCESQGYRRAERSVTDPGTEAWADRDQLTQASQVNVRAWRTREYTTTCTKTVRKRRR